MGTQLPASCAGPRPLASGFWGSSLGGLVITSLSLHQMGHITLRLERVPLLIMAPGVTDSTLPPVYVGTRVRAEGPGNLCWEDPRAQGKPTGRHRVSECQGVGGGTRCGLPTR